MGVYFRECQDGFNARLVNSLLSLKNVNKTQISKVLVNIDRVAVHPSLPLLAVVWLHR